MAVRLGEIQTTFQHASLDERVQSLHDLANGRLCGESATFNMVLQEEAHRLLYLVKENTFVHVDAFQEFTEALATSIVDGTIEDVRNLFAAYRRNANSFLSLTKSVVHVQTADHEIACAVAPKNYTLFVSTGLRDFLPDYDLSIRNARTKKWLLSAYLEEVQKFGLPCQMCLIEKEFGPKGPCALAEEFAGREWREKGLVEVFGYGQGNMKITGSPQKELPIIIPYDLIASGDGLRKVATGLRTMGFHQCLRGVVLYSFSADIPPSSADELSDVFDEVRVLHNDALGQRSHALPPVEEPNGKGPFKHHQLVDVDPFAGCAPSLGDDMRYTCNSEVTSQYSGQWIAVLNKCVVAEGKTRADVLDKIGEQRAFVKFVTSPEDITYELLAQWNTNPASVQNNREPSRALGVPRSRRV